MTGARPGTADAGVDRTADDAARDRMPAALAWLGVVLIGLCGALAAVLEILLVPLYRGATLIPIAVVFALASNVVLPRLALRLVPRTAAAAVPFVTWLAVVIGFGVVARPEGDVILPGGTGWLQWVSYGVMFGGAFVGIVSVVTANVGRVGPGLASREGRVSR